MTEPTKLPRVYGDKEIGRILKRATELQHREPSAPAAGVTLADLEEIAAEAGIDPVFLRRAALEVDSTVGDSNFWTRVVGDDLTIVREITLSGELTEDGFERIVGTIQANSREHGQPSLMGRTLTWRAETPSKTRTMQIVVTSRDGGTHIRFEENLMQIASGLFGGLGGGFGIGVGMGVGVPIGLEVLGSALFAFAAPLGLAGITLVACRGIYRNVVKRRRKAVSDLFDRVVIEAEASMAQGASGLLSNPNAAST